MPFFPVQLIWTEFTIYTSFAWLLYTDIGINDRIHSIGLIQTHRKLPQLHQLMLNGSQNIYSATLFNCWYSWCLNSSPLSIIFTLQPSSLSTSFVLHPMALGKSSFMFSNFREPPSLRGSHYPRKGGCCSVWRTVSQSNCVYGLCKDSIFFSCRTTVCSSQPPSSFSLLPILSLPIPRDWKAEQAIKDSAWKLWKKTTEKLEEG